MEKLRKGFIAVGVFLILISLMLLDYGDLSWSTNSGKYGLILTAIAGIIAMVYSIQHDKKKL